MSRDLDYEMTDEAGDVFKKYIERRMAMPFFSNARTVRNAMDRARMNAAIRVFDQAIVRQKQRRRRRRRPQGHHGGRLPGHPRRGARGRGRRDPRLDSHCTSIVCGTRPWRDGPRARRRVASAFRRLACCSATRHVGTYAARSAARRERAAGTAQSRRVTPRPTPPDAAPLLAPVGTNPERPLLRRRAATSPERRALE